MHALSTTELLSIWESGFNQPPVQRALTLLAAACPESAPDELAQLSIGQRDARLLRLRELTFGSALSALASCPACGEQCELTFNVADLHSQPDGEPPGELDLKMDDHELRFRLPTSADLLAVSDQTTPDQLLDRCLLTDRKHLPASVREAVVEQMARADPLADIQLALTCSACAHAWQAPFDIVSFFWREINAWARTLLNEVHLLAAAYGWRESDILALSAARRQLYLEMVSA